LSLGFSMSIALHVDTRARRTLQGLRLRDFSDFLSHCCLLPGAC
jgi:hypothetical protein